MIVSLTAMKLDQDLLIYDVYRCLIKKDTDPIRFFHPGKKLCHFVTRCSKNQKSDNNFGRNNLINMNEVSFDS